jgi:glutaminyl-tRNA synthetase
MSSSEETPNNFIYDIIREDLGSGKNDGRLMTRFPPEPNGYLHIGHAKSICINGENLFYASDYFEPLYQFAQRLIQDGKAYVDSQSIDAIRQNRGDFYKPGINSPYRDRPVNENLDLFQRMRAGEFEEGSHVLRAKIDMASPDLNLRDPLMYRIRKVTHHRTGDSWPIYPIYDFAHGLSDAIEGITHSICTLEFQDHRPLYDWFVQNTGPGNQPRQIEFARLNLTYTILSKRNLQKLVESKRVSGWDDPRMPTISGLRRRGYTSASITNFCERIGVTKRDTVVDVGLLEHSVREDLDATAPRVLAVLRPLRVVIENLPEGEVHEFEAPYHPKDESFGSRIVPLSRVIYIDREDFMETPPGKFKRLAPGREVRLRYACLITCNEVLKDDAGEIVELRCTWDPESLGGMPADGRKVKGTIHWVSAAHALPAQVHLYDRLFNTENPMSNPDGGDFLDHLNSDSMETLRECLVEPSLSSAKPGDHFQFERTGYFNLDPLAAEGSYQFNRTITLRDTWAKKGS